MNPSIQNRFRLVPRDPWRVGGVVLLVLALALFAFGTVSLLRSEAERLALQTEYDGLQQAVEQALRLQEARPATLRQRIAEARQQLQTLLSGFPTPAQAANELAHLYRYAAETQTQLSGLEAILNAPEEQAQTAYQVQRFVLRARGEVPALLSFLGRVGSSPYPSLTLNNIIIRSDGPAAASAELVIYASPWVAVTGALPPTLSLAPAGSAEEGGRRLKASAEGLLPQVFASDGAALEHRE